MCVCVGGWVVDVFVSYLCVWVGRCRIVAKIEFFYGERII